MNKKIIYLIGAIVGVAAVTLLSSEQPETTSAEPAALSINGLTDMTASATATVTTPDMTDAPEDGGTAATDPSMNPAGSDELPVGAEVAPQAAPDASANPMPSGMDEKVVPPSEGQ